MSPEESASTLAVSSPNSSVRPPVEATSAKSRDVVDVGQLEERAVAPREKGTVPRAGGTLPHAASE